MSGESTYVDAAADGDESSSETESRAWSWVPTLYFAQGLPYSMVNEFSVPMLKRLGVANSEITFYTRLLSLPWVIKPLWSPLVDVIGTKRLWVVATQLAMAVTLLAIGMFVTFENFFYLTLAGFALLALISATHDVSADGFYIIALSPHDQAWYVGLRSTFYRVALVTGSGLLVILAGWFENANDDRATAWSYVLYVTAAAYGAVALMHAFLLPRPKSDGPGPMSGASLTTGFRVSFVSFFRKPGVGVTLAFLLLYRFAEAQLTAMKSPFLLDGREIGGIGLKTEELGTISGTIGVIGLTVGGILGGWLIARDGLKAWIWWLAAAINLPNVAYLLLAITQPESLWAVGAAVCVEMFGYGLGFAAYLVYMMYVSQGEHATSHYAICTGFMAAGIMIPGMSSGWLQEQVGYQSFFVWILLATIPSFVVTALITLDPEYGKREPQ